MDVQLSNSFPLGGSERGDTYIVLLSVYNSFYNSVELVDNLF